MAAARLYGAHLSCPTVHVGRIVAKDVYCRPHRKVFDTFLPANCRAKKIQPLHVVCGLIVRKGNKRLAKHANVLSSSADFGSGCLATCPGRKYDALLVDVGGTLLDVKEPVDVVYQRVARKHGIDVSIAELRQGIRQGVASWMAGLGSRDDGSKIQYVGDGKPFWRHIVENATGSCNPAIFEELYEYYKSPDVWQVAEGAEEALTRLRQSGVKLCICSNFDTRLKPLLRNLGCIDWFDEVVVSAEVGHEKPAPQIFLACCERLGVPPTRALHVGDDLVADVEGGQLAGVRALLFKQDVSSFKDVAEIVLKKCEGECAGK
eukprot:jgi/Mesvir1/17601/Mv08832-RA.1